MFINQLLISLKLSSGDHRICVLQNEEYNKKKLSLTTIIIQLIVTNLFKFNGKKELELLEKVPPLM